MTIVEINESLFNRKRNHDGLILPRQWGLGGICWEIREYFIEIVPDRSSATLTPMILNRVRFETIIITNKWRADRSVAVSGFALLTVNRKYNIIDSQSGAHTQNMYSQKKHSTSAISA